MSLFVEIPQSVAYLCYRLFLAAEPQDISNILLGHLWLVRFVLMQTLRPSRKQMHLFPTFDLAHAPASMGNGGKRMSLWDG